MRKSDFGRNPFGSAFLLSLFLLFSPPLAPAQELSPTPSPVPGATPQLSPANEEDLTQLSLEDLVKVEVVVAASKSEEKATEAPASISIITSQQIRAQGYRTMDDLLRSVRDFYITDDRQYTLIGMRGFGSLGGYNDRILMLVDGHRINDGVYNSFLTGQSDMVDMDMIDRVEIIRGPASSLYGSNAFFGIINIITRKPKDVEGLDLTGSGGSLGTIKGEARYGGHSDSGVDWLAEGSVYDSAGNANLFYPEYDDPNTNNGIAQNDDGEQSRHAYLSLGLGDWALRSAYNYRKKTIPTGVYDTTFDDPGTYTSGDRLYSELVYQPQDKAEEEFSGRAYIDYADYLGNYVSGSGASRSVNVDYSNSAWWGSELQWTFQPLAENKLTVGSEFRDYFQEVQGNYTGDDTILDDHHQYWLFALFAQDEIRLLPRVNLTLGGRFDDYSTFGGQAQPRGALILDPWENTVVKLLAGGAFRAPNAYELYYNDGGASSEANPNLDPETIQTYEVEWEQSFLKEHRFIFSLFHYSAENLISQTIDSSDGLLVFENIGRASANGVDGEYQFQSKDGIQGSASYTLQRVQDDITGQWLADSPQQLAKAGLQFPLLREGLSAAGEFQYTGASLSEPSALVPGYAVVNLKLYASGLFAKGLDATLAAYNLFDTRYYLPDSPFLRQDSIQQNGLVLWGSLSYQL
jgi:iron complex outermembrane receptor protein